MEPGYLRLHRSGELEARVQAALAGLSACRVCPRACGVDRLAGEIGFCRTGRRAGVASFHPHFGEEAPLVGAGGSGTVFFAGCDLGCVFCQNFDISHVDRAGEGEGGLAASAGELAGVMLDLQARGVCNINLVTPSHVAPQILEALPIAAEHGLRLPLVWNSGGYDAPETLALLDGVVDIYMPDVKFWEAGPAGRYLAAPDYPEVARAAVAEMHRQVGDLDLDGAGLAVRGLLVRHLVMPGGLAGTGEWMRFLAGLSRNTCVNVMAQYRPCGEADRFPELGRGVTPREFEEALALARSAGITRLDREGESPALRLLRLLR